MIRASVYSNHLNLPWQISATAQIQWSETKPLGNSPYVKGRGCSLKNPKKYPKNTSHFSNHKTTQKNTGKHLYRIWFFRVFYVNHVQLFTVCKSAPGLPVKNTKHFKHFALSCPRKPLTIPDRQSEPLKDMTRTTALLLQGVPPETKLAKINRPTFGYFLLRKMIAYQREHKVDCHCIED